MGGTRKRGLASVGAHSSGLSADATSSLSGESVEAGNFWLAADPWGPIGTYAELGTSTFWAGDFAALDRILDMEDQRSGVGPLTDEEAALVVLQRSAAAVVASLRGQSDVAEFRFFAALEPVGGSQVDRARVLAYSLRAALASDGQPERALSDVRIARELAVPFDDPGLLAVASIGEGFAKCELGQFTAAAEILRSAARELPEGLTRSVAELRLAEVQLRMGDRAAARLTVDRARNVFLAAEARYWGARAALLTGAIDRDRGGRWLALARELSLPDPAYERLFLPEGVLQINLTTSPVVQRDGVPVEFLTRHAEAALRLLALSGNSGMSVSELGDEFWPDVATERQRACLRTLLWQIRNSLGADAWRLQRQRDQILFDSMGITVVGATTKSSIIAEFSRRRSTSR